MRPGPTRYTAIGDAQIAYQITDTGGPVDFVYMIGQGSAFELWWDHPLMAKPLERFASFGRLILFDRRGFGCSDRPPSDDYPSWEHFAEDLAAVLDAAGSERAAILAAFDGGPAAMTFAATYPDRVSSLVLWNTYARWYEAEDYAIGQPLDQSEVFQSISELWGTEEFAKIIAPEEADDAEAMRWLARSLRFSATPQSWAADSKRQLAVDARPALPLIAAPSLVMWRRDYLWGASGALARYLAEHIPDARVREFDGQGSGLWGVETEEILSSIEEFVTGSRPRLRADRVLATVLFTDIVGSTQRASELGDARWKELLGAHDAIARKVLEAWRGHLVKTTGDGLLARFDGPGRAIGCAQDLIVELRGQGIDVRAGIHAGEIELREDGDIGGIAVHIAARVQAKAQPGELLCSRTVKDLTAGSGVGFEDRGVHELKGVSDHWQLFAVT